MTESTEKYSDAELTKMVRSFRVSDLQNLLRYFGRNSNGKKTELQSRAVDLLKIRCSPVDAKILEIHDGKGNTAQTESQDAPVANEQSEDDPLAIPVGPGLAPYVPSNSKYGLMTPHIPPVPQYPVNPDVKMIDLPFYDMLSILLKPTSLASPFDRFSERERNYVFYLTPQQTVDFSQGQPDVQVQARMCLSDSSCEQDDEIPADITMKVNRKMFTLPHLIPTNKPGALPKRPKRPMDISSFIKRSATEANEVSIAWTSPPSKPYALSIYLVRRQNSCELIRRLKANGVRNPDHTTAMIKEKLTQDRDSEIATMSLKGALTCPLGKIRMKLPCRALTCSHLQCFDATLYLQMNEKKPKWICPVCDKPAFFKNLAIDGLFLDISSKAPAECSEVQFHEDGSWTPVMPVKKPPEASDTLEATPKAAPKVETVRPKPKRPVEVISLDSDSDTEEDTWSYVPAKKKVFRSPVDSSPVVIDSPDSSEDSTEVISAADPEVSSTSKDSSENLVINIPDKSSLPPLPTTLDIDTDEDCVVGSSVEVGAPGGSSFEDISPVESPESSSDSKKDIDKKDVLCAAEDQTSENTSDLPLFSLCDESVPEETVDNSPLEIQEVGSPDVIDLD